MQIIDCDIEIASKWIWTKEEHDMSDYSKPIRDASHKVMNALGNKIYYTAPFITGAMDRSGKIFNLSPCILQFNNIQEIEDYLTQDRYKFYFVKAIQNHGGIWDVYVHIQDNLDNVRKDKLKKIGI